MSDWRSHDASQDFKQKRKRELDSGTAVAYGHRFDPTKHEREQEVRDEHGRRRLHGAFTGGFSAGYFGTVSSKEGWAPSTFVSSRSKRAKATSNVMDYMDAEDIADLEETMDLKAARETKRRALLQADDDAEPASEAPQDIPVPARKIQSKIGGMGTLAQMDDDEDVDGFDIGPKIAYSKTREKQKKIKTTATVSHTFKSSKDVQAKTAKQQALLEEMDGATIVEDMKDETREPELAVPVLIHPERVALHAEPNEAKQDLVPNEEHIPPWRRKSVQTSEPSKDHLTGPSLDTRLAKAALKSTFNPYAQDAQKSQRYRSYLTLEAAEPTPRHDNRAHLESDVFSAELTEFHRAALMFGSSAGAMAQRFTSAIGRPETASVSAPVTVMAEQVEAARLGLFGHRTRVVEPWFPTRLLCKRFGVADPHPEGKAAYQQQQEVRVDDHVEQRAQIEALMRREPVAQQVSAHKPASTPTKPISRTEPARTSAAFQEIFGNDSD